jgi:dTMP kinase
VTPLGTSFGERPLPNSMAGKFITFEGGEGTGKSTQTQRLADYLRSKDIDVILTREPGGSEGAELIRALLVSGATSRWDPVTEVLLLYAARLDHWQKVIEPALQQGMWVICDRFADSTLAYQGYGHGVDRELILDIHNRVLGHVNPDQTFIFDLDPAVGVARALNRHTSETRFENMAMDFHNRMRQGFLEIAQANPSRCIVIDAQKDMDTITAEIVARLLGAG